MCEEQLEKLAPRPRGGLYCWDSGPGWGSESIVSSWSGSRRGGAARLVAGWGVSRGYTGVSMPSGLGVLLLTGVRVGGMARPSGVVANRVDGSDTRGLRIWPPISRCVGRPPPIGVTKAWDAGLTG